MSDLFVIELFNRFRQCPPEQRSDFLRTMIRLTAELTLEWQRDHPEGITEFLMPTEGQLRRMQ